MDGWIDAQIIYGAIVSTHIQNALKANKPKLNEKPKPKPNESK